MACIFLSLRVYFFPLSCCPSPSPFAFPFSLCFFLLFLFFLFSQMSTSAMDGISGKRSLVAQMCEEIQMSTYEAHNLR